MKKLVMVMAVVLMSAMCFAQEIETYRFLYAACTKGSYKNDPLPLEQFKDCPDGWSIITQGDKLIYTMGEGNMLMYNIVGSQLNKHSGVTEYELYNPMDGKTAYMYAFRNQAIEKLLAEEGTTDIISLEFDIYLPTEQATFHLVTFERL